MPDPRDDTATLLRLSTGAEFALMFAADEFDKAPETRTTWGEVAAWLRAAAALERNDRAGRAATPAPAPRDEGLRARIEAETHREVDAPTEVDGVRLTSTGRWCWAEGYTAACDALRAALASPAPAATEAGEHP